MVKADMVEYRPIGQEDLAGVRLFPDDVWRREAAKYPMMVPKPPKWYPR